MAISKWSPCLYLDPRTFSADFSPQSHWGSEGVAGWVSGSCPWSTHHTLAEGCGVLRAFSPMRGHLPMRSFLLTSAWWQLQRLSGRGPWVTQEVTQHREEQRGLPLVGQGWCGGSGVSMWPCWGGRSRSGCQSVALFLLQSRLHVHDGPRQFGGANIFQHGQVENTPWLRDFLLLMHSTICTFIFFCNL